MSSDRSNAPARPLKPSLASTRTARTPLAPRLPANNTPSTLPPSARRIPIPRSEPPPASTPRPRQPQVRQEETPTKEGVVIGNITPRSSARKSRVESRESTPSQAGDSPSFLRPRVAGNGTVANGSGERNGGIVGLNAGYASQGRASGSRPKSLVSDGGSIRSHHAPLVRSTAHSDLASPPADESIDSRFFHASDMSKHEPAPKRPTVKKSPTFFYADGRQDERTNSSSRAPSPVLSAVSEQRSIGPWAKTDSLANPIRSTPLLSPSLASLPATSPFFAAQPPRAKSRSPSPSKENVHLSYRKGASQIFGARPSPSPSQVVPGRATPEPEPRRISSESKFFQTPHRKTPSLSSIDSGSSHQPRRRSATTLEPTPNVPSPLSLEAKSSTYPKLSRPPSHLPSIDTTFDPSSHSRRSSTANAQPAESSIASPTKPSSELAADARRERKVLDLEISNSSLLAINSSLEREVRRQKAELKRFRRLSRAGRFSVNPNERAARFSEGLSVLGEEDGEEEEEEEGGEYGEFGPPSGFTEVYDDFSDDDEEEDEDDGDALPLLSPSQQDAKQKERLAKDEKRLRVDLERHKELLVQSQMMNQSLKRCTLASETMIKDGRKALQYQVQVADIKLGGRILTGEEAEHDAGAEGEVADLEGEGDDEDHAGVDEQARGFLDLWQGLGGSADPRYSSASGFESSEGGDRDSGIEVEKPGVRFAMAGGSILGLHEGRPPDEVVRSRPGVLWTNTIS